MSKYFIVNSREKALKLKELTGQRYYVFKNGEIFSFLRTKAILDAWEIVKIQLNI